MNKLHQGSCHCGAVRFECMLDLQGETSRCNCSICLKQRFWKSIVPTGEMRITSGADQLTDYQFGKRSIHHLFCRRCGTKPFGRGHTEPIGDFYAINVAALDGVTPAEFAEMPIVYQDGLHDRWDREPAHAREYL